MARSSRSRTDYGPTDEFVGVCHLVIARIAPDVRVVDVVHGIRGVRAGSAMLAQSLPEAPEDAIHLAVVDPGVGTDRRAVAIASATERCSSARTTACSSRSPISSAAAIAAYELSEPWFMRPEMSSTFHGRDIFAPAAAHLALGVPAVSSAPRSIPPRS